jgi:hypothetical protein
LSGEPTLAENARWTARYGSPEAWADAAEESPYMDTAYVWWEGMSYWAVRAEIMRKIEHEVEETPGLPSLGMRPRLPNEKQLKSYSHASLEKAVKIFSSDGTRGDVERAAKLPPHDARRVRLMLGVDLFRLNADVRLVVDERVARKGSRYALRYLDENGSRWLDPKVELRGR